jgi:regulator of RNase E activity RraB
MAKTSEEANIEAFVALKDAGCDFTQEHKLDHLFIGDQKKLEIVKSALLQIDYFTEEPQNHGQLLIHNRIVLDPTLIQEMSKSLDELAVVTGTEYDGWGTAI